ncbi:MAG: DUF2059 domain-containing protein [Pseudomonadota bacterium]
MTVLRHFFFIAVLWGAVALPAASAERGKIAAFMEITGFDVALDSMRLSAGQAPMLLGLSEDNFGEDWSRLADDVFESASLRSDALDILEQTMDDEMLNHAAAFYASELGQRLVAAENAGHLDDSDESRAAGEALVIAMLEDGSPRIGYFRDMSMAIGSIPHSIRLVTELQVRFLMAASGAGLIEEDWTEEELRGRILSRADEMAQSMMVGSITNAAYTYRDFSDDDLAAYVAALEEPLMQKVYELMHLVQAQLQVQRFETLAKRMVALYPEQDI